MSDLTTWLLSLPNREFRTVQKLYRDLIRNGCSYSGAETVLLALMENRRGRATHQSEMRLANAYRDR